GDRVLIEGNVLRAAIAGKQRNQLECVIDDGLSSITLRFFHFTAAQKTRFDHDNLRLRCFGEVRRGFRGGLEMMHPEYQFVQEGQILPLSDRLTPIYPTTKGLHQKTWLKLTDQALALLNK